MTFRVGLVCLGMVIALGVSCAKPEHYVCDVQTCTGCCDSAGVCQLGDTAVACGFGAVACVRCAAGQVCGGGSCVGAPPDSGMDGGRCGILDCDGCCDALGQCQLGTASNACGSFGGACADCGPDGGCADGLCCGPANCQGCCVGATCIPFAQETSSDCGPTGAPGEMCLACTGFCNAGVCTPDQCGLGNCNGCCTFANNCIAAPLTTNTQCGLSGVACFACASGTVCNGGVCTSVPCNGVNCAAGCCDSFGNCVLNAAQTQHQCGWNGNACSDCGNAECYAGNLGGLCAPSPMGAPCTDDAACVTLLGPGAICRLQTSTGVPYTGGMCTFDCSDGGACPASSTCVDAHGLFGETSRLCWGPCVGQQECRLPGYMCWTSDAGLDGCWIDPSAPAGLEGTPCSSDSECVSPTGPGTGFCLPSIFTDGGSTGGSGECSAFCYEAWTLGVGDAYCGDGGACVTNAPFDGYAAGYCAQACADAGAGQDVCRAGYLCEPGAPTPFCAPSCLQPGQSCPVGWSCNASGYCEDGGVILP